MSLYHISFWTSPPNCPKFQIWHIPMWNKPLFSTWWHQTQCLLMLLYLWKALLGIRHTSLKLQNVISLLPHCLISHHVFQFSSIWKNVLSFPHSHCYWSHLPPLFSFSGSQLVCIHLTCSLATTQTAGMEPVVCGGRSGMGFMKICI